MRKLSSFILLSLDGLYADANSDMNWAHQRDEEWDAFSAENASGGGGLVFGRITYQLMASYWPTPAALQAMPAVARQMNDRPKYVFSRTLDRADWNNTTLVKGDLAGEIRRLKASPGPDLAILGSGSIVAQLASAGLLDGLQIVVCPVALGGGKALFAGIGGTLRFKLNKSRAFANGNVVHWYEPAGK